MFWVLYQAYLQFSLHEVGENPAEFGCLSNPTRLFLQHGMERLNRMLYQLHSTPEWRVQEDGKVGAGATHERAKTILGNFTVKEMKVHHVKPRKLIRTQQT